MVGALKFLVVNPSGFGSSFDLPENCRCLHQESIVTFDYLYGPPNWSVCVGIELDGVPVGGVVHAPALGETYFGQPGLGARCRTEAGERCVAVNPQDDLTMALVATGFGYAAPQLTSVGRLRAASMPIMSAGCSPRTYVRPGSIACEAGSLSAAKSPKSAPTPTALPTPKASSRELSLAISVRYRWQCVSPLRRAAPGQPRV